MVQDKALPIILEKTEAGFTLYNSSVKVNLVKVDDLTFEIPPYESALKFEDKKFTKGHWVRYHRTPEFKLPFIAKSISKPSRFETKSKINLEGEYEISLGDVKALGTFKTINGIIKGSILSPYGDFGHIEGFVDEKNKIHLYSFDGVFSYIFEGDFAQDEIKDGKAYAGLSWSENFSAKLNPDFEVTYPSSEDILFKKNSTLSFKAESLQGLIYNYDSTKINKVQIVQLFGSWCPNCQDETQFFNSWYPKYQDKVELVALAFERSPSKELAIKSVRKSLAKLKPNYPFFLASFDSKEEISTIMPEVKKITAYPTTFILDKKGRIRHIHVGFNGPQTGHHFDRFVKEFEAEILTLLNE